MRIALLQLPLLNPNYSAVKANVPLAAGYLSAWYKAHGTNARNVPNPEIIIAPRILTDFGGDAAIAKWILENNFDIAGFTCYMWNIERVLRIASRLREKSNSIFVIAGGPEITEDCAWLENPAVDTFVIGEGESAFSTLIDLLVTGAPPDRVICAPQVYDLAQVRNPYLCGELRVRAGEPVPFETTRGCPFGCTYCFYSKSLGAPRSFPESSIRDFFNFAEAHSVSEIYIMDPSFNSSKNLQRKLRTIRDANSAHIRLHTEINLELVDEELSGLLADAGFVSVEAGLQSVNKNALKSVKRYFNEKKFVRGARLLGDKEIAITTGIILGLPDDTLEGFSATIDFVLGQSLAANLEIYPLSVLPGTVLRKDAARLGIEYMSRPPYRVLESGTFSELDFIRAREIVADKLGIELFHDVVPGFANRNNYISLIDLRNERSLSSIAGAPHILANNCTIVLCEEHIISRELRMIAQLFRNENESACIQLVIRSDKNIPEDAFVSVSDLFFRPDHYVERIHSFDDDNQGRFGTRVFQLTGNIDRIRALSDSCSFADPILLYDGGSLSKVESYLIDAKPIVFAQQGLPGKELESLRKIYSDHPEYLIISEYPIA